MRERKWRKKIKSNAVISLAMVIALIIGLAGGVAPLSQASADVVTQEAQKDVDSAENDLDNSISGTLWIDANENGTYDENEQPLADFPVYLYLGGDPDSVVESVTTGADGMYLFENIEPGSYVVGIKSDTIGQVEYLLPLGGIADDNKFAIDTSEWIYAYTEAIEVTTDSVVTDIDAGLRTQPQISPMDENAAWELVTYEDTQYKITISYTVLGDQLTIGTIEFTAKNLPDTDTRIGTVKINTIDNYNAGAYAGLEWPVTIANNTGATQTMTDTLTLNQTYSLTGYPSLFYFWVGITNKNGMGTMILYSQKIGQFLASPEPPAINSLRHLNVGTASADLEGNFNINQGILLLATSAFKISSDGGGTWDNKNGNFDSAAGTADVNLTGLAANTRYHYSLTVSNNGGTTVLPTSANDTYSFLTKPDFNSWSAEVNGLSSATVSGTFIHSLNNQNINNVTVSYTTDSSLTNWTDVSLLPGEFDNEKFSRSLTGLSYGTTYHVKVTVENDAGTTSTEVRDFTTPDIVRGYKLYQGSEVDESKRLGNYETWALLVAGIKNHSLTGGEYSIDLCGMDLTPTTNWSTAFNTNADTGNLQYFLHFYSSTNNALTLASGSVMGAHVRFREGLVLNTPNVATGQLGSQPLVSQIASTDSNLLRNSGNNAIFANGWKFVVDKGVDVQGSANLYAGTSGQNYYNNNKTVIDGLSTGYLEVNSGTWRYIGASLSTNITHGAYKIIIGNNDDPNNPVKVDAVFGREYGYMRAAITDADTPSEYIEVTGHTIVQFGVAISIYGATVYQTTYSAYTTQKVVIGGYASILKTWGAVDQSTLNGLSDSNKNSYIRISVTASSVGNGYGHYINYINKVNIIVEIRDHAYIAGDVVGNGANIYFNVHSDSKGVHISIKDYAQVGGNVAYGGSSSAGSSSTGVTPTDSKEDPFFTMEVIGANNPGDVKIGGHLLATNGEDNSNRSSWAVVTRVQNATVNGSVFGYGNLASQDLAAGITIKNAEIDIDNSIIGGGVYGVATGSGTNMGSCTAISITIDSSTVGHVAPLFAYTNSSSSSGTNVSGYFIGSSSVNITNSMVTGRTVLWRYGHVGDEARNLPTYSFVTADSGGTKTPNLKALATITGTGAQRSISFNTDGYAGIELETTRPEISMTTSMNARDTTGMVLFNNTISLAASSGNHTFSVTDTDFTRTNGNPLIVIMDRGDGTLGASATVSVDNCHATAGDKKLDVAIFGELTGTVTTAKIGSMAMNLSNTNDLANVGFAQSVTTANSFYINTKASIVMDNTVVDNLFGKGGGANEQLRNVASDTNRVQFQFKNHNTISRVEANGADVVFCENSVSYLSGFFNNTRSTTVFNKEYVETETGARVYLGNTGASGTRTTLGGAKQQRVFGSISGTAGELYVYKETGSGAAENATYPIYVAEGGSILEKGMNLGEWSSADGTIATADKETVLNAAGGKARQYTIAEPGTSKDQMGIQAEHDVLIAFGTTTNALVGRINDAPLRPWPIIKYSDANTGASAEQYGWLVLGKPRYQVIYQGSGIQADNETIAVEGKIGTDNFVVRKGVGTSDDYLYLLNEDNITGRSYAIEAYTPVAAQATRYTFLYWKLYGSTEGALEGVTDAGVLIPANWSIVTANGIANSSGVNVWVQDDTFTLKTLLESRALNKENSKVLTLVPVYQPNYVCKIGNQGYFELKEAFDAINAGTAAAEADGSYQIKMLVEEYPMDQVYTIAAGRNITITTAGGSDPVLPYKGAAGTHCTLQRSSAGSGYNGKFFVNQGTLTLTNLVLDGNAGEVTGSTETLVEVAAGARLNLLSGSVLENNRTNKGITASAVTGADATSILYLNGTVIQNNEVSNAAGGGAILSGTVILEGKVVVTDNYRSVIGEEAVNSNICLDLNGTVEVVGSLSAGSAVGIRVQDANHVDEYEFAATGSNANASASYLYFSDDYADSMGIMVSTANPANIMFKGSIPFSFTKVKAEDTTKALAGVEFNLYKLICEDSAHDHTDTTTLVTAENTGAGKCWEMLVTKTSDAAGLVDFEAIEEGTYMLVETKTASGYKLPAGQWKLRVTPTGVNKLIIQAHGTSDDLPPAFMTATDSEGTVTYKLPNIRQLSLPLSGMPGIRILQIIGAIVALLTILLYILRKRSNDRRRFILLKGELANK